jgi:hypothetical protein
LASLGGGKFTHRESRREGADLTAVKGLQHTMPYELHAFNAISFD